MTAGGPNSTIFQGPAEPSWTPGYRVAVALNEKTGGSAL